MKRSNNSKKKIQKRFEASSKLIQSITNRWAMSSGIPFQELHSEANLIFYEIAIKNYNLNLNIKFSTFLYNTLNIYLFNYTRDNKKHYIENKYFEIPVEYNTIQKISLSNAIKSLTKESKFIVNLVLNMPNDFYIFGSEEIKDEKISMNSIIVYLRKKGWSKYLVMKCIKEIKEMLKSI